MPDSPESQKRSPTSIVGGDDRFALTSSSRIKNVRFADLFDQKSFNSEHMTNAGLAVDRFYTKAVLIILRARDYGYQLSQDEKDLLTDIDQLVRRLKHEFETFFNSLSTGDK